MVDKETPKSESRTILMLAYLCIKDLDNLPEQVAVLDRFELTSAQIATVCGVPEGSVRNARMQGKKAKATDGRRKDLKSTKEE